ncbi:Choline dehydrogenase [Gossypium arboreum]|uniref:Choline dehydrogenase n=1 Tax=Gossypium arboreum TaxID=29729 RepID=A0A0B0PSL4_GOSAR|nr:Choline dehydrogenase [Gossypium arboreum]
MLPINYESWHNMPDSNKNQALSNIKERFALEVSDAYIKKALGKKWRDNKSILKKEYFKKPISLEEKLQNVSPGMLRYQWEDAVRFWNSKKGEEKLKDKKAEYETTASTDSSVNFEDIDNRIINEVLGPERYGRVRLQGSGVNPTQYFGSTSHQYMPSGSQSQAEVQRLKDQIVQIQASTDEQISQLRAEAAAR